MITAFDIYLISEADSLSCVFFVIAIIFGTLTFFNLLSMQEIFSDEEKHRGWKLTKVLSSFCVLFVFFGVLTPSSKTLTAMYIIPTVAKAIQDNKQIQQIPQAVVDLIKSYERKDGDKS